MAKAEASFFSSGVVGDAAAVVENKDVFDTAMIAWKRNHPFLLAYIDGQQRINYTGVGAFYMAGAMYAYTAFSHAMGEHSQHAYITDTDMRQFDDQRDMLIRSFNGSIQHFGPNFLEGIEDLTNNSALSKGEVHAIEDGARDVAIPFMIQLGMIGTIV